MRSFFKMVGAGLLALVIFSIFVFFFLMAIIGNMASKDVPAVAANSVLILDLKQSFDELEKDNPALLLQGEESVSPSLYSAIRLIHKAAEDPRIKGILIQADGNGNSSVASEEIRNAISSFRSSGKFVIAFASMLSQSAYDVATAADKVYLHPKGFMEFTGYSVGYAFFKTTLDKLKIEPQIFYAGKFKSATEPFRSDRMSPENKLQTSVWMNDLYDEFLIRDADARDLDTATLRKLAAEAAIQSPADALKYKLVDQLKYDDEVKDEIKEKLGLDKYDAISFISFTNYFSAHSGFKQTGEKIAMIVAEGNIVDGKAEQGTIGGENYRSMIRKARLDNSVKAIVVRINSGGGSALASETMWRELALAKADKPVIVSFGDVAASGGYYMGVGADSIFAMSSTITGSIGVFAVLPNMEGFFKDKLGVSFDAVRTGPYADMGAIYRPLNDAEKNIMQTSVNLIYEDFKFRVAEGRKLDTAYVDSIAQGRVWTGKRALQIGLVDAIGGIERAIQSAATMAKLDHYRVVVYPEPENFLNRLFKKAEPLSFREEMKKQVGEQEFAIYEQLIEIKQMTGNQARWPYVRIK